MGEVGRRFGTGRSLALGATLFVLGCGKVRDETGGTGGHAGRGTSSGGSLDAGEMACPGTEVRIGDKCVTLGTLTPCLRSPASGFPGDSQCLGVPDPSGGMQLHYGPNDYTDPDEVAKFVVAPGAFGPGCLFMTTPNAALVHLKEWHGRLRPGAFETLLFEAKTPQADSTDPGSCGGSLAAPLVSMAGTDLDLSFDGGAPELAGAGMSLAARTPVSFNVLMFNTTDAPLLTEAWLNGLYAEEDAVDLEVAPISWLGGLGMNIAPHTNSTVRAGGASGMSSCVASEDMRLLALIGSTGSHTTHMAADVERAGSRTRIYESFDWSEPKRLYYNTVVQNPRPDPSSLTTGGASGVFTLHSGDAISWECVIENTTSGRLTFSDDPIAGEVCNFYGVWGAGTKPWECLSF